jgi:UDP-2-acetamido-3-amino-2,3-dideoxy-glucuronate N-acetyltransferase
MNEITNGRPRIALLGAGNWGMNHLRVWREMGFLRIVCDPDAARLEQIRAEFGDLVVSPNPDVAITHPEIDAIVIAAPATEHSDLALRALAAGKDVLVEKPMAMSASEAMKLRDVASTNGNILMVNHVLDYHPAVVSLRALVEDGSLGKIHYIYSHRLNLGRVRTEEDALWSFAPHDVALMLDLLKRMPSEVTCRGGSYLTPSIADVTLMSLAFPNGIHAHIFVSWLHPFKEHRFVVVGDRQMAVFDDTADWSEKLVLYPHRVDWMGGRVPIARKAEAIPVPIEKKEPLAAACEHFVRCLITREQPYTDAQNGVEVLEVLGAATSSIARRGETVTLQSPEISSPVVHPTAIVDDGAEIGPETRVWHYSHVMPEARIGRGCVLGQNVFVGTGVRIGSGVKIQNNVSIYEGVELEDGVFCGPSAVFTNVINPRSEVERKDEFRRTLVKRGATLGANCTILCGVTIGSYAFVAAGATVTSDVPPFGLVMGVPARLAGWMCRCGERLNEAGGRLRCGACGREYEHAENGLVEGQVFAEEPTVVQANL